MKIALCLFTVSLIGFVPLALASAAEDAGKPIDAPAKWTEVAEKNFKAMDSDGDGMLAFDEFKGKRKKAEAIEQAEQIFKLIDTDGDKKLSLKEFVNRPAEARFKQMDKNSDGKLTFEEFKGRREKPDEIEQVEQNFKRMDTDGDKSLTLDEFKAAQKKPGGKNGGKPAKKKFQPEVLKSAQ